MTPAQLAESVQAAVGQAVVAGQLAVDVPVDVHLERPKARDHGDYATNVALRLAKPAGRPAREVATTIADWLRQSDGIDEVEVAGPGFLNIRLAEAALGALAGTIVAAGPDYGHSGALAGQRLNLEFVSANPTGPIHIGAVRWAAVGDALARLLQATGADVTREYYFNDAGAQIERFAASLHAVARGEAAPEGGYVGAYIADIAAEVIRREPGVLDLPEDKALQVFGREGVELMFAEIKIGLADFGVHFDVYSNERDLHAGGEVLAALERLRAHGHTYDAEGATWLGTTEFGDDKDRPLVTSAGRPTYIAVDAAYYLDKRRRGFDRVVIMLGADHHGYIARYRALAACFGDDPDRTLEILIGQMVNLVRDGQPMRMSKRAGTVVTLDDLVEAIGVDAARYALARYSVDSTIDLDLDLWAKQTNDNPVFYVQYAHARLASLARRAAELGIERGSSYDASQLSHERENDLLAALGEFPRVVTSAAQLREPHRVARYLEELAGSYHRFYDSCRVLPVGEEEVTPCTIARLWLCEATRVVLAGGLQLLGVSAPDRM